MAKKRRTPPDDMNRLKENLITAHGNRIKDRASFNRVLDEYLGDNHGLKKKSINEAWKLTRDELGLRREKEPEPVRMRPRQIKKDQLDIVGIKKGKTVFARTEVVKIKGKSVVKLRDAKGQFVARRKK